jgi:hypothetical protein
MLRELSESVRPALNPMGFVKRSSPRRMLRSNESSMARIIQLDHIMQMNSRAVKDDSERRIQCEPVDQEQILPLPAEQGGKVPVSEQGL